MHMNCFKQRIRESKLANILFVRPFFNRITFKLYRLFSIPYQIRCEKEHEEYLGLQHVEDASLFAPLTETEKREVVKYWGITPSSYREYELYKHFRGFDVRFMPMSIYLPLITRRLNDYQYTEILEHKSLFGYLTKGVVKFPKCFVRVVNGEYYSDDMRQITKEEAIESCLHEEKVVLKDSLGGSGGKGIEILKLGDLSMPERKKTIEDAIRHRYTDFVIQEFLYESEELKRFNPSSVNTIRVQSLYLNGKWSPVTVILRFGGAGSEVDNLCSGGYAVGVYPDGHLFDYGFNFKMERADHIYDIVFKETKLSFIPSLLKHVEEAHVRQFPICKYIGWDMIIDRDGNPVCIEINSCQNGHPSFQLSAGPTFGDRTQEVIDYCNSKKLFFNKSLLKY